MSKGPRRRLPAPHMRRALILDAAASCFSQKGYGATTMDDIAELAALPKPSLYEEFASKADLHAAALAAASEAMVDRIVLAYARARQADRSVRGRLGIEALVDFAEEQPASFDLLFGTSSGPKDADEGLEHALAQVVVELSRLLTEDFEAYVASVELAEPATTLLAELMAAGIAAAIRRAVAENMPRTEVIDLLAEFVVAGCRGVHRSTIVRLAGTVGAPTAGAVE